MSPERITGGDYGTAADVWGLGLTLMTVALGRCPVNDGGRGYWALLHELTDKPPPSLPARGADGGGGGFSDELRDFLGRMLVAEPAGRWSAGRLLAHPFLALNGFGEGGGGGEREGGGEGDAKGEARLWADSAATPREAALAENKAAARSDGGEAEGGDGGAVPSEEAPADKAEPGARADAGAPAKAEHSAGEPTAKTGDEGGAVGDGSAGGAGTEAASAPPVAEAKGSAADDEAAGGSSGKAEGAAATGVELGPGPGPGPGAQGDGLELQRAELAQVVDALGALARELLAAGQPGPLPGAVSEAKLRGLAAQIDLPMAEVRGAFAARFDGRELPALPI